MTGGAFPTWPASWGAGTNNTSLLSMYAVVCLQDTPTATPTATPPITFTLTPTPTFTPSVTFTNTGTPQPVATPIPTPGGLYSLAGNIRRRILRCGNVNTRRRRRLVYRR
jgi:hypothetical protein